MAIEPAVGYTLVERFLTMKKFALLTVFAVSGFAAEWTGVLSDASCGAKHADATEASQTCAKRCFEKSGNAVLVVGDKVIKVNSASFDKVAKDKMSGHMGHKVTVTGKMDGDTVVIESVKMAE